MMNKNGQEIMDKSMRPHEQHRENKERGISRIDSSNTHGWFVRVYRDEAIYSKLFSDGRHGGKPQALEAAVDYRNELEALLDSTDNRPRRNNRLPLALRNKRNKTGVIGVCYRERRLPSGRVSKCYSVSWAPEPNVQKCTSFSITKYGKEEAFRRACTLREQMLKEIVGDDCDLPKSRKKPKRRKYVRAEKIMKKLKKKRTDTEGLAA
ncbi:Pathogenesis-related transcriptional factor and ERF protein [Chloroherpeton thalassium ATCC 35110]|uniref:Pathogenesis-related transcriptional factor and ERF protein n=1 Tax=Chloroherpeton thalassium (strain ATCC 35110 / GB-78) TaxID=517418 RepID=B3QVV7_CHLT3|nr:AP2/ERF family transcription factor [Chloroherpeton thalassium]ACF13164.1 Pathogenesis-related transcriptional factor and ERF protein [Chloroherpeton thalassium ATCC 35110]